MPTYPSGVPLFTKETWMGTCTADTIPKVAAKICPKRGAHIKGAKQIRARGDLILTRKGIAGPLALNLSREIAPLIERYKEVPIILNLIKGLSANDLDLNFHKCKKENPSCTLGEFLKPYAPESFRKVLSLEIDISLDKHINELPRKKIIETAVLLCKNPLTITGTAGYARAIATKGGVSLKEINPNTLMSKRIQNLFFAGELVDMDGPCGGYNLTWAFSSGNLAGLEAANQANIIS